MEAKHTPGPWLLEPDRSDGSWVVWTRQPHTGELACVFPSDINGDYPAEANARLIAAAPELLAAANGVRSLLALIAEGLWEDCPYPDANKRRIAALFAAIAKAEPR